MLRRWRDDMRMAAGNARRAFKYAAGSSRS